MKIVAFALGLLICTLLVARARAHVEAEWVNCHLHLKPQPLVFIATISAENGRFHFEAESAATGWPPERLTVSPVGLTPGRLPEIGHRYQVSGRASCRPPHRWAQRETPLLVRPAPEWDFHLASLVHEPGPIPWRARFLAWLFRPLRAFPRLHALAQATWTGQTFYQAPALVEGFRVTGLMAILALSGEHVAVLLALTESIGTALFTILFPLIGRSALRPAVQRLVFLWRYGKWLGGASLLLWTSGGLASMKRTWWMALFFWGLKMRTLRTSALQCLFTTYAVVLAVDPRLALSPGFLLSAVATYSLFHFSDLTASPTKSWKNAMLISVVVPFLTWPWTAHLFSQVAVAGPLVGAICGAVWAAIFLPMGFFAPLLARGYLEPVAKWLERFLVGVEKGVTQLLPHLKLGHFTVWSPDLLECGLIECGLVFGLMRGVSFAAELGVISRKRL